MAREFRALTALDGRYPLAPRPILFCDEVSVLGRQFQILEYRDGLIMRDQVPPDLAATGATPASLSRSFVDSLADLHRLRIENTPLAALGRPQGFVERQVYGWEQRIDEAFGGVPPRSLGRIVQWLKQHAPSTFEVAVLHCDYKFDNLIFGNGSGLPVALIDWDMATLGDPLFDLGVALSYWSDREDPDELRNICQSPSLSLGFPTRACLAEMYLSSTGRSDENHLGYYLALGRLRLAGAWKQLHVLHERGALSGDRYTSFDSIAVKILDWTADTLDLTIQ